MLIKTSLSIKGRIKVYIFDGDKYPTFESTKIALQNNDVLSFSEWIDNLNPTVAFTAIARRMVNAGLKSNEGIVTYGAVGTGTSAPVLSNTQLASEIFRQALAVTENTNNLAKFTMFLTKAQGNDTLTEFGLFGEDATGTINSGTLFQRVLLLPPKEKTNQKTLTIESEILISA